MKLFSYDGGLMRFFNRLFDLMILSLIWWITSIPIVTIGASTTALYDTAMTLTKKNVKPFRYYIESFKKFFKPSTICWLVYLVLGVAIVGDYLAFTYNWTQYMGTVRIITGILVITIWFTITLIFPIICTFSGTIGQYFFNAFALSFMYAPFTLFMVLLSAGLMYIAFKAVFLLGIVILLGPGVLAFINSYFLRFIFRKYLPENDPKY